MVTAATTQHSRSPAPASWKKNDKRNGNAPSKSRPPSGSNFFAFQNPDNDMCKYHYFEGQQSIKVHFSLLLLGKLKCRQTFTGSAAELRHATATAMHFPANAGLIFLKDELTNDRYLVDTGATLSILFPAHPMPAHPMTNQSLLGFRLQNRPVSGQAF